MILTSPCFYPESFDHPVDLGRSSDLLTPEAFPFANANSDRVSGALFELTAAGTVQVFHLFPILSCLSGLIN